MNINFWPFARRFGKADLTQVKSLAFFDLGGCDADIIQDMKITFLGGTGTVTGSKYMVEDGGCRILVDCGLFQGRKDLRLRNWSEFPVEPSSIDAIVLTHAHLDHSGYIPLLVKNGFKGKVYCSPATAELSAILLADSGHLQEEDASFANRHRFSKHNPALPLYTEEDARACAAQFSPIHFGKRQQLPDGMSFVLHRAGHILGASMVELRSDSGTTIVFSGDLGRRIDPVLNPPTQIQSADYLVIESTYGDRSHSKQDPANAITDVVNRTASRGGTILIPAFAVGRAQSMLYILQNLKKAGRIPAALPVFLDSPMAIAASDLLLKYPQDHHIPKAECAELRTFARYTETTGESKAIDVGIPMPKIVVSASGMATGGRILHHFARHIEDARCTILLAGFQAEGTRGARLARGEKKLKFHGREWDVHAEIVTIDSISAHADRDDIMWWLSHFTSPPRKTFVTHGEPQASAALAEKINRCTGWHAVVPAEGHVEEV